MRLLVLPVIGAALAFAQDRPAFDAASVKPSAGGEGALMRSSRGSIELENHSLRRLVQVAYGLHDFAYSGPAWLDSVHFDIVAKIPAGGKFDEYPEMLQTLLAERFKLAVHRETREMPGLALVVDKKGPRIRPVEAGAVLTGWGPNMVQGAKISMTEFAGLLSNALDRPVRDLTALAGIYDIKIRWAPDMPDSADPSDLPGSVYAAVQELGLRLQAQKVPVEVVVVDRAERVPTEN